jgi:hypothetical protein
VQTEYQVVDFVVDFQNGNVLYHWGTGGAHARLYGTLRRAPFRSAGTKAFTKVVPSANADSGCSPLHVPALTRWANE